MFCANNKDITSDVGQVVLGENTLPSQNWEADAASSAIDYSLLSIKSCKELLDPAIMNNQAVGDMNNTHCEYDFAHPRQATLTEMAFLKTVTVSGALLKTVSQALLPVNNKPSEIICVLTSIKTELPLVSQFVLCK